MATVASVTAGSAGGAGYVWEDPGDSIMVQVSLDVIERLGAVVQQGLGAGPRGNEIGGILLGRTLAGYGRAVLIEDFELAPCEHLRGASYTLSPRDRRVLGTRLSRRAAGQVVGYFRSHTRPGMYLDQDDFTVFSQYFPEAWQVFLLVSPSTAGPAMGGFFFWEDGDINRRSTYRQFPFDCGRLAAGDFPITGEQSVMAPVQRPVPVLVPKPEARVRRKLPPLPWVVVPVIAVLFLIAGLFVSGNQPPVREMAAAKPNPPVEPLLPEPVPQASVSSPAASVRIPPAVQEAGAPPSEPSVQGPAVEAKPTATPKPKPAKKPVRKVAPPLPVTVERVPFHEVEAPPPLAAPIEKLEPKLAGVLPSRAMAAPPLEAEVSYEVAQPGVFRRALHKIDGTAAAFVPATPIRKVAPAKPAGAEARPVDVKVFIDDSGSVTRAQVLTKGTDLAAAALSAAREWQFTPARKHDKPVASEMVLHFRFGEPH